MKLVKTVEIDIDIDHIIEMYKLTSNSKWNTILESVIDYVAGFDDCEYYLISYEDEDTITQIVAAELGVQCGEDEE